MKTTKYWVEWSHYSEKRWYRYENSYDTKDEAEEYKLREQKLMPKMKFRIVKEVLETTIFEEEKNEN